MPLETFYSFSESQKYRAKNLFVKNGTAKFGRNILTEITTFRGDPECNGRKKPKQAFPFEFRPKFPESLAWKAPPVF